MNSDEWYIISDIDQFVEATRLIVYNSFGNNDITGPEKIQTLNDEEVKEINRILSKEESLSIAQSLMKQRTHKKTGKKKYMISDKLFQQLIEDLNTRMISNMVAKLASEGYLEMAYDSDINDFVFWAKDAKDNKKS